MLRHGERIPSLWSLCNFHLFVCFNDQLPPQRINIDNSILLRGSPGGCLLHLGLIKKRKGWMPRNTSSKTHEISEVICNIPKWSSDSERKHLFWAMEKLHAESRMWNIGVQAVFPSPACQASYLHFNSTKVQPVSPRQPATATTSNIRQLIPGQSQMLQKMQVPQLVLTCWGSAV